MKALMISAGEKQLMVLPLKKDKILIGRGEGCDFRLPEPTISRKHCEIYVKEEKVVDRSGQGIRVNGETVEVARLDSETVVELGPFQMRLSKPSTVINENTIRDSRGHTVGSRSPTRPKLPTKLVLTKQNSKEKPIVNESGIIHIGRGPTNELSLPEDNEVTYKHCWIEFIDDRWCVKDNESKNGTFVDERRVGDAELKDGEILRVGNTSFRIGIMRDDEEADEKGDFLGMIGESEPMKEVFFRIGRVAPTSAPVMIRGDTGTGKELVARAIHSKSKRKNKPWVVVDCTNIPSQLGESELFGHVKGAFTDSLADRTGQFEKANSGTIFLDEIGDLHLDLQAKLLRVLQEGEIKRVGSSETIKVDVRVIAATNQPLEKMVEEGKFRRDLFARLNAAPIWVPPLADRKEDIPRLARYLFESYVGMVDREISLPDETLEELKSYDWPENIRGLENGIQHAVVYGKDDSIQIQDLGLDPVMSISDVEPESKNIKEATKEFEKEFIAAELRKNNGNVKKTAKKIGMCPNTLRSRMQRFNLRRED